MAILNFLDLLACYIQLGKHTPSSASRLKSITSLLSQLFFCVQNNCPFPSFIHLQICLLIQFYLFIYLANCLSFSHSLTRTFSSPPLFEPSFILIAANCHPATCYRFFQSVSHTTTRQCQKDACHQGAQRRINYRQRATGFLTSGFPNCFFQFSCRQVVPDCTCGNIITPSLTLLKPKMVEMLVFHSSLRLGFWMIKTSVINDLNS